LNIRYYSATWRSLCDHQT